MQNLDEDAKDLPFSAPTTTSIPFMPRERVAAKADRWFPSRMMTRGFWMLYFPLLVELRIAPAGRSLAQAYVTVNVSRLRNSGPIREYF